MSKTPQTYPKFLHLLHVLLLLLIIFLPCCSVVNSQPNESEQEILLKLKQQWGIQSWRDPNIHPCDWSGIQCTGNSITGISLQDQNITNTIPTPICSLVNLTKLDLSANFIPGGFPTVLYNCTKLQILDLSQNQFVGPLPSDIYKLSSIHYLDISRNNFSGDIPPAIGQLVELKSLDLSENLFDGTFPPGIGNLLNLEVLDMDGNRFVPTKIPEEFGKLKRLKYMSMLHCNLIGEIPESFANLSSLEHLDLTGNNLVGGIPEDFGKLHQLEYLCLAKNQLSGPIPKTIGRLPAMKYFWLYKNNFSGIVPPELGLHSKLLNFDVSNNQFFGELPQHLCAGEVLYGIGAYVNNFSGEVPKLLAKCNSLQMLWIEFNRFTGEIPIGLWNLPNIQVYTLANNKFSGKLPFQLSENLVLLDISNNNFSGPIPSGVANWKNLSVFMANNNQLRGPIPAALGSLPNLNCLELSKNMFSGQIPPELGRVRLSTLDLSFNNLSGKIPSGLDDVAYHYNFLNNSNLCSDTQIPDLPKCSYSQRNNKSFSFRYPPITLVLGTVVILVILYMIFFKVIVLQHGNHAAEQPVWIMTQFHNLNFTNETIVQGLVEDNVIGSGGAGKVYCVDIDDSGGKVAVKRIWNDRKVSNALEKQFIAEAEILGRIRHTNIVKLWCCVSRTDSKLLVYEYMENHSLDKWLHRKNGTHESESSTRDLDQHHVALDWPTRLRIAIGAARGLCYMHHDCSPPIIHRDVKSSNILLDSDFNAKIADLGLAKMSANKAGDPHTVSAVAGSFGYIAPEYWRTRRLNEKIDIYSFGVVLLELATGKEPCKGNDYLNLADWSWQHYCKDHPIVDALDKEIKEPCFLDEMTKVFKLGLMCTSAIPTSRPSMKRVLQLLTACSHDKDSNRIAQTRDEEEHGVTPFWSNIYSSA